MKGEGFDVAAADADHVWHPYTQHGLRDPATRIVRAEGAYLYDASGRAIFDAISSWWVTLHGHAQPEIAEAIARQARTLEQVIFAGFTHEPAARLAAELVRRVPRGLDRVFFSDDGSTAVEVAVKMALQYWQNRGEKRRVVVALENAYHGDTFGAMSVSARGLFTDPFAEELFEVVRLPDPTESDVVSTFEHVVDVRGADVAALIIEPMVQGAGGMHMWPADSLKSLRELSSRAGVLLIADEVMTGFGRTGPLFACEHADVRPDLMCLSKGITGGFLPLGATFAREEIFESFTSRDRRKTLFHGHSYTANPIACAAALASLELLNEDSASRRRVIEHAHRTAAPRLELLRGISNVRVLGTILALDLQAPDRGYLSGIGPALRAYALERGVLLRPLGDTVYVLPPYCSTAADLQRAYDVIVEFAEHA
ncbi:MAG TPA: adenosylmethionine--8-amino-7-oxononanoate transaminase [Gemmatimonadaceae bacterium]|jgi:adenosylmethionine-8-amino-7-oxononanoate aminotransferase|nr:adenosylmethionine--8-amino-7-oxononanoate transaminase [Gemmatimonadaceae bacterium]